MKTMLLPVLIMLAACSGQQGTPEEGAFLDRVTALCGQAFEGEIVSNDPQDDAWRAERIVMHVAECSDNEIRIPLHVGDDRSRTWVLREEDGILTLRHDHRHEDGEPDALTMYGGAVDEVEASRLTFPADHSTKVLFDREEIPVSKQNTWALEVRPAEDLFAYEMARPNRFFRVEFDTSQPVDTPPPPWGSEAD